MFPQLKINLDQAPPPSPAPNNNNLNLKEFIL